MRGLAKIKSKPFACLQWSSHRKSWNCGEWLWPFCGLPWLGVWTCRLPTAPASFCNSYLSESLPWGSLVEHVPICGAFWWVPMLQRLWQSLHYFPNCTPFILGPKLVSCQRGTNVCKTILGCPVSQIRRSPMKEPAG